MATVSTAASIITVNTAGPRGPEGQTGPRGHAGTTNISSSLSNVIITGSLWISGSSHLGTGHVTASGNISARALLLSTLPSSDPATAGTVFVTGSAGMNLGSITGSGFSLLCISNG